MSENDGSSGANGGKRRRTTSSALPGGRPPEERDSTDVTALPAEALPPEVTPAPAPAPRKATSAGGPAVGRKPTSAELPASPAGRKQTSGEVPAAPRKQTSGEVPAAPKRRPTGGELPATPARRRTGEMQKVDPFEAAKAKPFHDLESDKTAEHHLPDITDPGTHVPPVTAPSPVPDAIDAASTNVASLASLGMPSELASASTNVASLAALGAEHLAFAATGPTDLPPHVDLESAATGETNLAALNAARQASQPLGVAAPLAAEPPNATSVLTAADLAAAKAELDAGAAKKAKAGRRRGWDETSAVVKSIRAKVNTAPGLALLIAGVGSLLAFAALVVLYDTGAQPSEEELVFLYPYGFKGAVGPRGERAPGARQVTFTFKERVSCVAHGSPECVLYEYSAGNFVGSMVLRKTEEGWKRVGDDGMPFRPSRQ